MSYLSRARELRSTTPSADEAKEDWTVNVDGEAYYVVDGDNARNVKSGKSIRLGGINAPETSKGVAFEDGRATKYKFGQVGGDHARRVLRDTLKSGNYRVGESREQQYGGGAGQRYVGDFIDKDTGESATSKMFREGVAKTTFETTRAQRDAIISGALNREIFGEPENDPYTKLRNETPIARPIFKEKAKRKSEFQDADQYYKTGDREWFATSVNDQLYKGAAFDPRDTDSKGYTKNPISNSFKRGLHETAANFSGAVSAIGALTGIDALEDAADRSAYVNTIRAENHPLAKISKFSDIDRYSDDFGEKLYNSSKWLATTAAGSASMIGTIIAGAALAPVIAPTAGVVATTALASAPSAILHAGIVWNGVDRYVKDENGDFKVNEDGTFETNRTPATAAISIAAGAAAATVERFGLYAIVNPAKLLTRAGFSDAATLLAKKTNTSLKSAKAKLNQSLAEESSSAYSYIAKELTKKATQTEVVQNILTNFVAGSAKLGTAAAIEGATEVIQEATTFLTAKAINEQPVDAEELYEFLKSNITDNPELLELAKESFAAGAGLGGTLNAAKGLWDKGGGLRERAWKSEANPLRDLGSFREASHAIRAKIGQSVSQVQDDLSKRVLKEHPKEEFDIDGVLIDNDSYDSVKGTFDDYVARGKGSSARTRYQAGETTALDEIGKGITSLVFTPLGNLVGTEKINAAPSLFKIASLHGGLRDALPGRNKDYKTDSLNGELTAVFSEKKIADRHNFNHSSETAQKNFDKQFQKFGQLYVKNKKNLKNFTQQDIDELAAVGIVSNGRKTIPELLRDFEETFADSAKVGSEIYKLRYEARRRNLGESDPRTQKAKYAIKQDWALRLREIDVEAINLNPALASQKIVKRLETLQRINPKNEKLQKVFADKRGYADNLVEKMRTGEFVESDFDIVDDTPTDSKTSAASLQSTSLYLSDNNFHGDGVDFSDFFTDNIFANLKVARERAVREAVDLDYNGDNNSKLDFLFSDARNELLANTDMTEAQVDSYLGRFAQTLSDVDDARFGNYNRLPDKWASLQDSILTYTSIIGLPLAAIASAAEVAGIAIGLRNSAEFKRFMATTGVEFGKALKRGLVNVKTTRVLPGVAKINKRLENELFEIQLIVGNPQETQTLATRVGGIENVNPALFSRFKRRLLDAFFTATLLKGLTGVQRTIATSTALDFIRNRAAILMHIENFDKLETPMTKEELDAYAGLGQIGINVPVLIQGLKQRLRDRDESYSDHVRDIADESTSTPLSQRTGLEEEILTGIQSFVNTRVQAPNASNRPLIVQDPRFKLISQFNAFLSSVTTTMVPKIWNDEVGRAIRNKNPGLSYEAFSVIVAMTAVAGAGQWLKDYLKYGENSPYLDSNLLFIQRAITSAGYLGQGEKLVEIVHPLYPSRNEGPVSRAFGTIVGAGGRQAASVVDLFSLDESNDEGKVKEEFFNDFVKFWPGLSPFSAKRAEVAKVLADLF